MQKNPPETVFRTITVTIPELLTQLLGVAKTATPVDETPVDEFPIPKPLCNHDDDNI